MLALRSRAQFNMRKESPHLLAIDPTSKGVSFAAFDPSPRLLDWGMRQASPGRKNQGTISRIRELVAQNTPALIVTEDPAAKGSRRPERIRRLIATLVRLSKRS